MGAAGISHGVADRHRAVRAGDRPAAVERDLGNGLAVVLQRAEAGARNQIERVVGRSDLLDGRERAVARFYRAGGWTGARLERSGGAIAECRETILVALDTGKCKVVFGRSSLSAVKDSDRGLVYEVGRDDAGPVDLALVGGEVIALPHQTPWRRSAVDFPRSE